MKTSKKILSGLAVIILVLLIITLMVLRNDIRRLLESQVLTEYTPVSTDKFAALNFSSHWDVSIRQGKDCKVELAGDNNCMFQPQLKVSNGTLYLSIDSALGNPGECMIRARVTAPFLQVVEAAGNTRIQMKNFWTDSLTVILSDSSTFSGKNNDIPKINFNASVNNE